jgi:hypothetical protein
MYLFYMIVSNQIANAHIYNSQTMARDRCPRNFSLLCTLYFWFQKKKETSNPFSAFFEPNAPSPLPFFDVRFQEGSQDYV